MARTRRTSVFPIADIRKKVEEKCVAAQLPAVPDATRNSIIDYAFEAIRGALRNKNRKDGDFIDIPGICRITVETTEERVVRVPRDSTYRPRGAGRKLSFKVLKDMNDSLIEKFETKPSAKIKELAEKKTAEALAAKKGAEKAPEKKAAKPAKKP